MLVSNSRLVNTPTVLLEKISSYLTAEDVGRVSQTGRAFFLQLRSNEKIWEKLARQLQIPRPIENSWRNAVAALKQLQKGIFTEHVVDVNYAFCKPDNRIFSNKQNVHLIDNVGLNGLTVDVKTREKITHSNTYPTFLFGQFTAEDSVEYRTLYTSVGRVDGGSKETHQLLVKKKGIQERLFIAEQFPHQFFQLRHNKLLYTYKDAIDICDVPTQDNVVVRPTLRILGFASSFNGSHLWVYRQNEIEVLDLLTNNRGVYQVPVMANLRDMRLVYPGVLVQLTDTEMIGYRIHPQGMDPNTPLPAGIPLLNEIWRCNGINSQNILVSQDDPTQGVFVIDDKTDVNKLHFYQAHTGLKLSTVTRDYQFEVSRVSLGFQQYHYFRDRKLLIRDYAAQPEAPAITRMIRRIKGQMTGLERFMEYIPGYRFVRKLGDKINKIPRAHKKLALLVAAIIFGYIALFFCAYRFDQAYRARAQKNLLVN